MNIPNPAHIIANLKAQTKKEALMELAGLFENIEPENIVRTLLNRENLGSTAIITGIALPHAKISTIDEILIATGRSKAGIHWNARDGQPVHLIFLMIAPQSAASSYRQTLSGLSRALRDNSNCALLNRAKDQTEIHRILQDCLQSP